MSVRPTSEKAGGVTPAGPSTTEESPNRVMPSAAQVIAESERFPGFVPGGAAVALPRELFVELLPRIEDEGELRATLYALAAVARPGPRPGVRHSQLLGERPLLRQFERLSSGELIIAVEAALARAVERGSLLAVELPDGDLLYLALSEAGRRQRERLLAGTLAPPPTPSGWNRSANKRGGSLQTATSAMSNGSAATYEREIGMLTPAVAEALAEADTRYPARWIEEALREAALHNARSWAYAEAILRRWEDEGRGPASTTTDGIGEGGHDASAGRDPGRSPYERVIRRSWP